MHPVAEVEVKEALEKLNLPGLKIRSVMKQDVSKKCKQLYERVGLKISDPEKMDEYDIQVIFADGDHIRMILVEVKSGNSYPWQSTELQPNNSLFKGKKGAWCQLQKGYKFTSELFADIPFKSVLAFTALPNTSRQVLENNLSQSCCSQHVLTLEDFQDLKELRTKLGLDGIRKPTRAAGELMVRMASRLLGAGSGLHLNLRQLSQVKSAEEKRLKKEMEEVDQDTWIVLDNQQTEEVSKAVENKTNLISIEGPPGSGKTIIGAQGQHPDPGQPRHGAIHQQHPGALPQDGGQGEGEEEGEEGERGDHRPEHQHGTPPTCRGHRLWNSRYRRLQLQC